MNQHHPVVAQYDEDFYAWTQQQAALLRQLEETRMELPGGIDLAHLAEEVEDLGKSELRGTTSLIRNIMVHLIKAASDPVAGSVAHWGAEAHAFHDQLPDFFTPAMRRLIQIDELWARARKSAARDLKKFDRTMSATVPDECPFSIDDFLSEDFTFDKALLRLRPER